jgi:hypothetical protein
MLFFRNIFLIFRETQFTAVLQSRYLICCRHFMNFPSCLGKRSRPDIFYFLSKISVLLADSLYTEDIEASKSCTASWRIEEWIWIFEDGSSKARFWNTFQSVSSSDGTKAPLVLTRYRMLNVIGRWSESRIWVTMNRWTFWCTAMLRTSVLPSGVMRRTLWSWNFEVRTNK